VDDGTTTTSGSSGDPTAASSEAGGRGDASPAPLLTAPFVLAFAVSVATNLVFHAFIHLPRFLADRGATDAEVGLAMGLPGLSAVLVRPWVGRAADVQGRRTVLRLGAGLHFLVCAAYLLVDGPGVFVLGIRVVHGVALASSMPVLFTIAADLAPEGRKTEGIALFGISGLAPLALAGLLGDWILAVADFQVFFATVAGLAFLAWVLGWRLPDSRPPARPGEAPPRAFVASLTQPNLVPVWVVGTCFALAISGAFFFVSRFVQDTGIGSVGAFFGAYATAAILLRSAFAWVPDRFGPERVLVPAVLTIAVGLVLLALAESTMGLIGAGLCAGLGHGFAFPIVVGMGVSRARPAERGSAMALATATFDVGALVGGPTFGTIRDLAGYPPTFATGAVIAVIGLGLFRILDRPGAPG